MSLSNLIPSLIRNNPLVSASSETKPSASTGPVQRPWHEIRETDEAWALTVHLPGVAKQYLEFLVDESQVRVTGKKTKGQPADSTALYRETSDFTYELVISHENAIDADKIHAEFKDGVLQASLPKAAAIKPRKISVG